MRLTRIAFVLACLALLKPSGAYAQELRAVATIKPVHSLLAAVIGREGSIVLLIDGAGSPHTYALKPSDAKALSQASLVVRASDVVEPFMTKVIATLPKTTTVVTLDKVAGLTLHRMREGGPFEAHGHANETGGRQHDDHGHKPPPAARGAAMDGHVWLDPENAKLIVAHLADTLSRLAPAKAAAFKANAAAAAAEIDAAAGDVRRTLAAVQGKPFVVFHDAYQYFEARYGMPAAGSVTISPDVPPSAKRLSALRAKVAKLGAACVFSEPQFEPKLVVAITEGTEARSSVLDPLGADIPAGAAHYVTLLRRLSQAFGSCLGGAR